MLLQIHTPVPKDIPLPLPVPEWLLVTLLVVSFLLHIVFIHLMVGGSLLTLWAQIKGLKEDKYDQFAHEVAKTITVNKSLAVVLGVAPLLSINTLYTVYFYSANALTGFAWILIIPLVIIAFLLTYLHKYTWDALKDNRRLHIAIIGAATGIFLVIPLIFLTNVNLMMFPEKWGTVKGFLSALTLPNVFPRYFEFLGASLTVTGIFTVWYNGRKNYEVEEIYVGLSRGDLKKIGYSVTAVGLALQILFGFVILFTLPSKGLGFVVISLMIVNGALLFAALWFTYKTLIKKDVLQIDIHFKKIFTIVAIYFVVYGGSRQMYRQNALHQHRELMAMQTESFLEASKDAALNFKEGDEAALELDPALGDLAKGAAIFQSNCSACHNKDIKLVGPPVKEMVSIYADNSAQLKQWIKAPGKKRPDFPQMPGFPQLSEDDLNELSKYILSIK